MKNKLNTWNIATKPLSHKETQSVLMSAFS